MKLKIVPKSQVSTQGVSVMTFRTNGLISFSINLVHELGLQEGTKILIAQDEHSPGDWYIKLADKSSKGHECFEVRSKNTKGKYPHYFFSSAGLRRRVLSSLGMTGVVSFRVSTKPVQGGWFAILTSSADPKEDFIHPGTGTKGWK